MLELVAGVELGIVGSSGLPHFPNDFKPALSEGAQGHCMAFAALTELLIVHLRPGTPAATKIGPEVEGAAQVFVALPAKVHFMDLAGLVADRRGASVALQALGIGKELAVFTDLAQ